MVLKLLGQDSARSLVELKKSIDLSKSMINFRHPRFKRQKESDKSLILQREPPSLENAILHANKQIDLSSIASYSRHLLAKHFLVLLLLSHQQSITFLERHSMSRVLIIGREAGWMSRLRHLPSHNLVKRILAFAICIKRIHEMHGERVLDDSVE